MEHNGRHKTDAFSRRNHTDISLGPTAEWSLDANNQTRLNCYFKTDLEADLLNVVCNDVEIEPALQDVRGEILNTGSNTSQDARLDVHARGFWERQRSAFFN